MEKIPFEQLPTVVNELCHKIDVIEQLLKLERSNPLQHEEENFLSVQQAAALLRLSVPTIYTLVSKAKMPVSKRGRRLYFSKQELINWVKEGRKKTLSEIQADADKYVSSKLKRR